jgi:hypothetical protein
LPRQGALSLLISRRAASSPSRPARAASASRPPPSIWRSAWQGANGLTVGCSMPTSTAPPCRACSA